MGIRERECISKRGKVKEGGRERERERKFTNPVFDVNNLRRDFTSLNAFARAEPPFSINQWMVNK